MQGKTFLARMAVAASLLVVLANGCASPSTYKNPDVEANKQRTMGTTDELSPLAPVGAPNVKRVGNQWTCEQNGRVMIYNDAASSWQPQQK